MLSLTRPPALENPTTQWLVQPTSLIAGSTVLGADFDFFPPPFCFTARAALARARFSALPESAVSSSSAPPSALPTGQQTRLSTTAVAASGTPNLAIGCDRSQPEAQQQATVLAASAPEEALAESGAVGAVGGHDYRHG